MAKKTVTMTRTSSVTTTKLLIASLAVMLSGGLALITTPQIASNTIYSCRDSDYNNPDVFGNLVITNKLTNKTTKIEDSCAASSAVLEGTCNTKSATTYTLVATKCASGVCSKGVCVPGKPPITQPVTNFEFFKHPSSTPITVLPGATNVLLAKYTLKPTGYDLALGEIALSFIANTTRVLTGNYSVKLNGATLISGPAASINNSGTALTNIAITNFPTLSAGKNVITIEGSIDNGATNGSVVTTMLDVTQVKRIGSGQMLYDPGFTSVLSDTVTVQGAALQVTTLQTPPAQSVSVGTQGVTLANISLDTYAVSSGEAVKVTKLSIRDTKSNGASFTDIGNLALYDQDGRLIPTNFSTIVNANTTTFVLTNPLIIAKNSSTTLTLKGDILSGSGVHTFAVVSIYSVAGVGVTTGSNAVITLGYGPGQPVTIITDGTTLTITNVGGTTASPVLSQPVYVGQTNVPVLSFKLLAGLHPLKIASLKLTVSSTAHAANNVANIRLYRNEETTPFATANQFTADTNGYASFTWTATDNILASSIQPNAPITIHVRADIGGQGVAAVGEPIRFTILSASDIVAKDTVTAEVLPNTAILGLPVMPQGILSIVPFNVVASADTTSSLVPPAFTSVTQSVVNGTPLARIKISNNGSAKVSIRNIYFTDNGYHTGYSTTYRLTYSDENSTNSLANVAADATSYAGFYLSEANGVSINGGSSRYFTVSIKALGSAVAGDNWQLGITNFGSIWYDVAETDLGYDANLNGTLLDKITSVFVDGKPENGTIVKL